MNTKNAYSDEETRKFQEVVVWFLLMNTKNAYSDEEMRKFMGMGKGDGATARPSGSQILGSGTVRTTRAAAESAAVPMAAARPSGRKYLEAVVAAGEAAARAATGALEPGRRHGHGHGHGYGLSTRQRIFNAHDGVRAGPRDRCPGPESE